MRRQCFGLCALVVLVAHGAVAADQSQSSDLRRAVPAEAFLAVYSRHNPERDYQRQYFREVWETVQETQIIERALKIVTGRVPDEDLQKAQSVLDELREAVAPIDVEAILNYSESAYAQVMQLPQSQHLLVMRLTPEAAAGSEEAIKNLFGLVEKYTEGQITVKTGQEGEAAIAALPLPAEVPFRPAVARLDDVLLVSTSEELLRQSLRLLAGGEGQSKFDDPRLKEALSRLPEPEDSLVFYDGKLLFSKMRQLGAFIRQAGAGDPNAERVAGLIELMFDELGIFDYEVTVEYTEGNQNRSAVYGKVLPGTEDKLLSKVLGSGQPFEDWHTWVPAGARSYWLTTGVNLHPVYERVVEVIQERIPEAQPALEKFESLQAEHDVYLDRDILQAFSGEYVSVSLPPATPSLLGGADSVIAIRCHKPERIRALLHRLVEVLKQHPAIKAQQLALTEMPELEGFEQVSALLLTTFAVRPVIGFRDGWMVVGSGPQAVQKVLDTRAGQGETIVDTEAFQQFGLEVEGPVAAIKYTNLAESTRGFARLLGQVGMVAPVIIGLAGAEADDQSLGPLQEVLGLLPSLAKIVAKFDFFEANLSVTQAGDDPGSYHRRTVTLIRPKSDQKE